MAQPTKPEQESLLPASHRYRTVASNGSWSTGLFDCDAQPGGCALCWMSACLPCVQYGLTTEKLGPQACCGGSCFGAGTFYCLMMTLGLASGCPCLLMYLPQLITRGEIRSMHGMQAGSASDCLTAWCCPACGLCQEAREVDIRRGAAVTKGSPVYIAAAPPQTQMMTQRY